MTNIWFNLPVVTASGISGVCLFSDFQPYELHPATSIPVTLALAFHQLGAFPRGSRHGSIRRPHSNTPALFFPLINVTPLPRPVRVLHSLGKAHVQHFPASLNFINGLIYTQGFVSFEFLVDKAME
jgi:hypothetical protein